MGDSNPRLRKIGFPGKRSCGDLPVPGDKAESVGHPVEAKQGDPHLIYLGFSLKNAPLALRTKFLTRSKASRHEAGLDLNPDGPLRV